MPKLTKRTVSLLIQERVELEWLKDNVASKIYKRIGEIDSLLAVHQEETGEKIIGKKPKAPTISLVDLIAEVTGIDVRESVDLPPSEFSLIDNFYANNTKHVSAFCKRWEGFVSFLKPEKKGK